ncbi:MAG TPA: SIR2 family protein [Thermoanaerobaculia bacterium]|nr:SIR2 family protein [Thermoanaerobaculia bacterium]
MARDYNEYAWHFRVLADAQREGNLVFVLGAGIGRPYGLPDWSQLLADLLLNSGRLPRLATRAKGPKETSETLATERRAIRKILQRIAPDPLIQGAIARAAYPENHWHRALHSQLWSTYQDQTSSEVLERMGRMIVRSALAREDSHISVLTFNFDDLLETHVKKALRKQNMDEAIMSSVSTDEQFEQTWLIPGIFIYHLHGYLGGPRQKPDDHIDTILDAASYVPVLSGDHWSWRCMDRVLTGTAHPSLFIGLSLADPSLRYVLTRWARWRAPINGVYLAPPPELPAIVSENEDTGTSVAEYRTVALMYRALMDMYSTVLDEMHLVSYHLTTWDEIGDILKTVEEGL